jgi:hypothetical protein
MSEPAALQDARQQLVEQLANRPHRTVPVQVWADVDEGVAELVIELNGIPGVRTYGCCQGTGTMDAYVAVGWADDTARVRLKNVAGLGFRLVVEGDNYGTLYARDDDARPD